jgi:prepilin-type N-terminal cleavage/methylation domain-containing protein
MHAASNHASPPGSAAFTLVEVMIAVAVMCIGMFGVLSMIPTLSKTREGALDLVTIRQMATTVAERIQGTAWKDLAGSRVDQTSGTFNYNAWSLPRYRDATTPVNPPLTETATDPNHNLITAGIIKGRSGIPDVKIYLEYYNGNIIGAASTRAQFYAAITGTTGVNNRMLSFADDTDTSASGTPSTMVRIIITWREQNGTPTGTHEIFVARKQ